MINKNQCRVRRRRMGVTHAATNSGITHCGHQTHIINTCHSSHLALNLIEFLASKSSVEVVAFQIRQTDDLKSRIVKET